MQNRPGLKGRDLDRRFAKRLTLDLTGGVGMVIEPHSTARLGFISGIGDFARFS